MSAVVACERIMEGIPGGTIGGTYGGNALACAAALKVIEVMERDHLADRSAAIGKVVLARLTQWQKEYPFLGDVRGMGGMIGIEFVKDPVTKEPDAPFVNALVQEAVRRGLMIENAGTYGNVIRFLAPLVMTDEQLEAGLAILKASIDALQ